MKLNSEMKLENIIRQTIDETDKSIKIFGGHLPLLYHNEGERGKSVEFGVDRWGEFSKYTFELSCRALQYAKKQGKEGKIIIIVDDLVEIPIKETSDDGRIKRESVHNTHYKKRKKLFDSGMIPESYEEILKEYKLTKDDLVTHKRKSGKETKMISEMSAKAIATEKGFTTTNECAHAYKGIIYNEDFFDTEKDYLISFIPGQCKGNVCDGLLKESSDLNALHLFFPHMESLGGIVETRNGVYKLPNQEPMKREEMYQRITYRFDKAK